MPWTAWGRPGHGGHLRIWMNLDPNQRTGNRLFLAISVKGTKLQARQKTPAERHQAYIKGRWRPYRCCDPVLAPRIQEWYPAPIMILPGGLDGVIHRLAAVDLPGAWLVGQQEGDTNEALRRLVVGGPDLDARFAGLVGDVGLLGGVVDDVGVIVADHLAQDAEGRAAALGQGHGDQIGNTTRDMQVIARGQEAMGEVGNQRSLAASSRYAQDSLVDVGVQNGFLQELALERQEREGGGSMLRDGKPDSKPCLAFAWARRLDSRSASLCFSGSLYGMVQSLWSGSVSGKYITE